LIGPTATYLQSKKDPQRFFQQKDFTNAAELLYPGCTTHPVHIAHRGIRPRLTQSGFSDFVIQKEEKPLLQLIGIESPGLTSCLAIANYVRRSLGR
jgi:L-2-hydroxyglutarate oxidase LhgO